MDVRKLKQERDSARREIRTIANANSAKISELKEHFFKATELKALRNRENALANEFRGKRDEVKKRIAQSKRKLSELREKMNSAGGGRNPAAIQEEIERLEWVQQTEALSAREEKELSKRISELRKQLPHAEGFQQLLKEYSGERQKLSKLIEEEKRLHEKTVEHSKKAQQAHDSLIAESKKISATQESISKAMQLLKQKESVEEEKHGELVKTIGEKRLKEIEERQRELAEQARRLQEQQKTVEEKARRIFERFKTGGKITTEEMMVLQQSGIL